MAGGGAGLDADSPSHAQVVLAYMVYKKPNISTGLLIKPKLLLLLIIIIIIIIIMMMMIMVYYQHFH